MARFGVGREHNLPWSVAGFHEINRYFHQDLSFVSFLRFSSFFFFLFPLLDLGSRPFSKNTVGPIKSGPREHRAVSGIEVSPSLSLSPCVLFPLWSALRAAPWKCLRISSLFLVFHSFPLFFVCSRSRALPRIPSRSPTRFRFHTYELNGRGPIKREARGGNHLEREREREKD